MGSRSKGLYRADQDAVTTNGRKKGHKRRARVGKYIADPGAMPKPLTREQLDERARRERHERAKAQKRRTKMLAKIVAPQSGRQRVRARKKKQRAAKAAAQKASV